MSKFVLLTENKSYDLTCELKDAHHVAECLRECDISFRKKYTTLRQNIESTMTFVGLKPQKAWADIVKLIVKLNELTAADEIGNAYMAIKDIPQKKPVIA